MDNILDLGINSFHYHNDIIKKKRMISLIHPSRGRPDKAFITALDWITYAGVPVEYIISLDADDPKLLVYKKAFANKQVIINDNKSVVDATNHAAKMTTGDILIYLSDDFRCPANWGNAVIKEFQKHTGPTLIKVDDCLQKFNVPVLTIPMMNRELYNLLGYFWHPEYKSMFVDEHLYWRAKKLGALKFAPHLKFEHCHVSVGKAQNDETYIRSAANWEQGKVLFAKHKAAGFIE